MVSGKNNLTSDQTLYLGSAPIAIANELNVLGATFRNDDDCPSHSDERIRKCRK